jgi:hypothetical protein
MRKAREGSREVRGRREFCIEGCPVAGLVDGLNVEHRWCCLTLTMTLLPPSFLSASLSLQPHNLTKHTIKYNHCQFVVFSLTLPLLQIVTRSHFLEHKLGFFLLKKIQQPSWLRSKLDIASTFKAQL